MKLLNGLSAAILFASIGYVIISDPVRVPEVVIKSKPMPQVECFERIIPGYCEMTGEFK